MNPFHPKSAATVSISATNSSAAVALAKPPTGSFQVRVYNAGTATVFIARGDSTVTADATTNLPVPSGAIEVFTYNNNTSNPVTHVAAITATGTATVYFSTGEGI